MTAQRTTVAESQLLGINLMKALETKDNDYSLMSLENLEPEEKFDAMFSLALQAILNYQKVTGMTFLQVLEEFRYQASLA